MEKYRALIFNIQKFSIHDGPGIRTVVFFKGCPLSCKWCSNPESQSGKIQILKPVRKGDREQVCGKYMDIDSVMFEVLQDKAFYEESGGGVTVSGGEPLVQIDFVQALLSACKKEGLHTAVETTGFAAPEVFKRIFDVTDLFLFDVKHYDRQKHLQGTGVEVKETDAQSVLCMHMIVGYWYENRNAVGQGAELPFTITAQLLQLETRGE